MTYSLVLQATAFHSTGPESFEILENRLFCINRDGTIGAVLAPGDPACGPCLDGAKRAGIFTRLGKGQFLLPGFIDTHVHAPQWAQVGKALDTNLPVWLKNYTFPLEAAYKNLDFAQEIYADLVDTLTANDDGTILRFRPSGAEQASRRHLRRQRTTGLYRQSGHGSSRSVPRLLS